ncbi:RNA polymerase-binding protein DksA [Thioalkalivibrio sp. ALJ16]|uniref:RNA polymerase-binding protein DksA n=1 Tax=Thioalkalivibrio sp. ALJ16 TaxID=1158762 RepID=UPI00038006D0|nr:RNA polymerase-binding protein DksA [Thioalkalivibrio sp. ALJ16]
MSQEAKTHPDSGYRPSEDEPYMNPRQLDYFRAKLEAWRAELIEESEQTLEHLRTESWQEPDPNDRASHETDAGLELRTRDRYRKLLNKIDAALLRIDRGEYGYCEETGEPIGLARLEARPIATLSVAAQEAHERDEARYAQ